MSDKDTDNTLESSQVEVPVPPAQCGLTVFTQERVALAKRAEIDQKIQHIESITLGNTKIKLIAPRVDFGVLCDIAESNNTILDCTAAMQVNADGTGFRIEPVSGQDEDVVESEVEFLTDFFNEVWPGKSITVLRKEGRVDLEFVGNGYYEVIRNVQGQIKLLRKLEALKMLLVKLDEPIAKKVSVLRGGKLEEVEVMDSERRYALVIKKKTASFKAIYYKEFGATRELDRETGEWANQGQTLPANKRASEILHLRANVNAKSPYGMPRWWHKLPSVLGSRESEELNLEYFQNGGVPPALITLSGGRLAEESKKELQSLLGGAAKKKLVMAVLSAIPTGGSIDKESPVKINVERFGSEQQKDSLFENYDKRTEEKIIGAYRIPGIFLGQATDYSYATAFTSYLVGEEQVFAPERQEFDDMINTTVMREFFDGRYKFVSNPMATRNPELHIDAVGQAWESGLLDPMEYLDQLNKVTGLSLQGREGLSEMTAEDLNRSRGPSFGLDNGGTPEQDNLQLSDARSVALDYLRYSGMDGDERPNSLALLDVMNQISRMGKQDQKRVALVISEQLHGDRIDTDLTGHLDCCSAAVEMISEDQ